jgi:hypothetical protein
MKKIYTGLFLIVMSLVTVITGCSSDVASSQEVVLVSDEDGDKFRDTLIEQVDHAKEEYYNVENGRTYVMPEEFDPLQDNVSLIIKAIDSDLDNPINGNEFFDEAFEGLKNEINELSNEQVAEAVDNLTNPSTIYEATVMWDFHYALDFTDVKSSGNGLSRLIGNYDTMSVQEIKTEAQDNIDYTEDLEYETLQEIRNSVDKYSEYYSDDQLKSLNSAIEDIETSKKTQVNIMKQITATFAISDTDVAGMLENADADYNSAFTTIENLETGMDVIFVDESSHNLK